MQIGFLLNGEAVVAEGPPTRTLLDWLREERGLTGTKEGCNEGDCGACTVMVTDERGPRALNACILFLPQLQGKAVRTVEGIAAPDGTLHPVQAAMVERHGSQCGFCTPGFVVSMAVVHTRGDTDHDRALAGNLCRCTGYAPIARAFADAAAAPVAPWLADTPPGGRAETSPDVAMPESEDEAAAWYAAHPDATVIAGATDVGLWVTKQFRDVPEILFLGRARDMAGARQDGDRLHLGAGMTMTEVLELVEESHPSWAAMIRRYGSEQVRNAATLGGNVANGSPIGDNPPCLIAMNAELHLRHGDARRTIPVEDFFLEYGRQDRAKGELVTGVTVPATAHHLRVHKLAKRNDQDISALCGAFVIDVEDGTVARARLAFGGMAGTPKRARAAEAALIGQPWTRDSVEAACLALRQDFEPLTDMRATAEYRMAAAQGMLRRHWHESQGERTALREVAP